MVKKCSFSKKEDCAIKKGEEIKVRESTLQNLPMRLAPWQLNYPKRESH